MFRNADGSASVTLPAYDLGEAIRWAMAFGAEARVVAPPEAVRLAAESAKKLAERYESPKINASSAEKSA